MSGEINLLQAFAACCAADAFDNKAAIKAKKKLALGQHHESTGDVSAACEAYNSAIRNLSRSVRECQSRGGSREKTLCINELQAACSEHITTLGGSAPAVSAWGQQETPKGPRMSAEPEAQKKTEKKTEKKETQKESTRSSGTHARNASVRIGSARKDKRRSRGKPAEDQTGRTREEALPAQPVEAQAVAVAMVVTGTNEICDDGRVHFAGGHGVEEVGDSRRGKRSREIKFRKSTSPSVINQVATEEFSVGRLEIPRKRPGMLGSATSQSAVSHGIDEFFQPYFAPSTAESLKSPARSPLAILESCTPKEPGALDELIVGGASDSEMEALHAVLVYLILNPLLLDHPGLDVITENDIAAALQRAKDLLGMDDPALCDEHLRIACEEAVSGGKKTATKKALADAKLIMLQESSYYAPEEFESADLHQKWRDARVLRIERAYQERAKNLKRPGIKERAKIRKAFAKSFAKKARPSKGKTLRHGLPGWQHSPHRLLAVFVSAVLAKLEEFSSFSKHTVWLMDEFMERYGVGQVFSSIAVAHYSGTEVVSRPGRVVVLQHVLSDLVAHLHTATRSELRHIDHVLSFAHDNVHNVVVHYWQCFPKGEPEGAVSACISAMETLECLQALRKGTSCMAVPTTDELLERRLALAKEASIKFFEASLATATLLMNSGGLTTEPRGDLGAGAWNADITAGGEGNGAGAALPVTSSGLSEEQLIYVVQVVREAIDVEVSCYAEAWACDTPSTMASTLYDSVKPLVVLLADERCSANVKPSASLFELVDQLRELTELCVELEPRISPLPLSALFAPFLNVFVAVAGNNLDKWTPRAVDEDQWVPATVLPRGPSSSAIDVCCGVHYVVEFYCSFAWMLYGFPEQQSFLTPAALRAVEDLFATVGRVLSKYGEVMAGLVLAEVTPKDEPPKGSSPIKERLGRKLSRKSLPVSDESPLDYLDRKGPLVASNKVCFQLNNLVTAREKVHELTVIVEEAFADAGLDDFFVAASLSLKSSLKASCCGVVAAMFREIGPPMRALLTADGAELSLTPIFVFLDDELETVVNRLSESVFQMVLSELWELICDDWRAFLLPAGGDAGPRRDQLDSFALVLEAWLDYMHADGAGLPRARLEDSVQFHRNVCRLYTVAPAQLAALFDALTWGTEGGSSDLPKADDVAVIMRVRGMEKKQGGRRVPRSLKQGSVVCACM